jgi:uncharacterized DUF497 family protein
MKRDEIDDLFAGIRGFSWDPEKRATVLRDRQIDFDDLRFVLVGPTIISGRIAEARSATRYSAFLRM